jgi:hypothetical protein
MPDPVQEELPDTEQSDTDVVGDPEPVVAEGEGAPGGPVVGSSRLGQATVDSRYAAAMLLHAFFDRVGAQAVFAPLAGAGPMSARSRRFDDVALLTATTVAFALGVGSGRWPGWIGYPSCGPCGPGWASWPRPVIRCGSKPTWLPR